MRSLEQSRLEAEDRPTHVRHGRSFGCDDRSGGAAPYLINRFALKLARNGSVGRWEAYEHSRELMLRFDEIGKSGLLITGVKIGPDHLSCKEALALEIYLKSAKGLKYFRRTNGVMGFTRGAVIELLSRIGIPTYNVSRIQPTNQIPAGPADKAGLGEDSGRPLFGR